MIFGLDYFYHETEPEALVCDVYITYVQGEVLIVSNKAELYMIYGERRV